MRNKLYTERIEICLRKEHKKILVNLCKKYNKTMNEVIREALMELWEDV